METSNNGAARFPVARQQAGSRRLSWRHLASRATCSNGAHRASCLCKRDQWAVLHDEPSASIRRSRKRDAPVELSGQREPLSAGWIGTEGGRLAMSGRQFARASTELQVLSLAQQRAPLNQLRSRPAGAQGEPREGLPLRQLLGGRG